VKCRQKRGFSRVLCVCYAKKQIRKKQKEKERTYFFLQQESFLWRHLSAIKAVADGRGLSGGGEVSF